MALASSLDQIGPLTKDVKDCAMVMESIAVQDKWDATSVCHPNPEFTKGIENGVQGLKIALPKEFFAAVSDEVKNAVLPHLKAAHSACFVISAAEASSNLGKFDGIKFGYRAQNCSSVDDIYKLSRSQGFGKEVKRRILLGTMFLSTGYYEKYYSKSLQIRTLICNDFKNIFERYDLILTPTTPTTAYKLGEKQGDSLDIFMGDICTSSVNMAGLPALSLPCGADSQGLPVGMQLIGKAFDEQLLFRAAYAYEQNANIGQRKD